MFDVLNSHSASAQGFKHPISRGNVDFSERNLRCTIAYLYSLTLANGKQLASSGRKTFIIGFDIAARSLITLARRLFSTYPDVKFVLAHKLSQDHIETLFSKIRSRGGFNNNPNVIQFISSLKGLLVKQEVTPSSNANCLEVDVGANVLLTPRRRNRPGDGEDADLTADEMVSLKLDVELPQSISDTVQYIGKIKLLFCSYF